MDPLSGLLALLGVKSLQKPLVFVCMLVAFLAFSAFGILVVLTGVQEYTPGAPWMPMLSLAGLAALFFGLAGVCFHMMRRSFH